MGEISEPGTLPTAVAGLNNVDAVALLELASDLGKMTERLRTTAAGVVAQRSSKEMGHSGLAQSRGHRSAVTLVQQLGGVSRAEASRQVRVGRSLLTAAEDTEAEDSIVEGQKASSASCIWQMPLTHALLTGVITSAQHDAIARGLGGPPHRADGPRVEAWVNAWSLAAEQLIAEAARVTVEDLAKSARGVRDALDPVGAEQRFLARHEARSFRIWTDQDGLTHGSIVFDDLSAAWIRSTIDAAMRPRRGGPRFVDPTEQAQAAALIADPRSNEQLVFDLFIDVMRAGTLADAETVFGARQPGVRLVQIMPDSNGDVDTSSDASGGTAYTEDGIYMLPGWVAKQQACSVGTVTISTDGSGNPLNLGRSVRLYTARQRVALAIRDGGCRWVECDRPASYCEAHHIDSWAEAEGRTDIDRGISLCRFHHMQLHHGGWRITRNGLEDFMLHDPGGSEIPLPRRLVQRYAWAGVDPPPKRFLLAA